jgi:hypothetical protein
MADLEVEVDPSIILIVFGRGICVQLRIFFLKTVFLSEHEHCLAAFLIYGEGVLR